MMRSAMASELNILTRALNRLSEGERRFRDFTLNGLRRALTEVIACFPVYRTYVTAAGAGADDAAVVDAAIAEARRRNPVQEPSIFEFIRLALLPGAQRRSAGRADARSARGVRAQVSAIHGAGRRQRARGHGVLQRRAARVGQRGRRRSPPSDPDGRQPCTTSNRQRLAQWPLEMTAGSTHDTKWGEDARARINVLVRAAARLAGARQALVVDQRARREMATALGAGSQRRVAVLSGAGRGVAGRTARQPAAAAAPATRSSSGCSATCERR